MGFHADQEAVRVLALSLDEIAPRPGVTAPQRRHGWSKHQTGSGRSTEIVATAVGIDCVFRDRKPQTRAAMLHPGPS